MPFGSTWVMIAATTGDTGTQGNDVISGLRALWGAVFTTLSFLTTTGYTSADWITSAALIFGTSSTFGELP